mgnify:CR=1 FL=1
MKRRNVLITTFVVVWTLFFHYQTFRAVCLSPWFQQAFNRPLPRIPLLFPPAGWIMFYRVDASYGFAEVYGLRDRQPALIDPHDILETKALGYDNIHRNALVGVLSREGAEPFCRFLKRKFPAYEQFAVVYGEYPDVATTPDRVLRGVAYRCN